jgi:hypothetical protein
MLEWELGTETEEQEKKWDRSEHEQRWYALGYGLEARSDCTVVAWMRQMSASGVERLCPVTVTGDMQERLDRSDGLLLDCADRLR